MKRLFLSHYNGDAGEVRGLATELRLRGVTPWVDKDGGFAVGDDSPGEARRAIREECFGLLLYATETVFTRPFIRDVEVPEARAALLSDPTYLLFAVPKGMDFAELHERSVRDFGFDLSASHAISIPAGVSGDALRTAHERVADEALERVLRGRRRRGDDGARFSLQFSTRERLPDFPEDAICIDASVLFADAVALPQEWERVLRALRDVKTRIANHYGRPRLYVHGSKHLAAAFLFGRVFAQFALDIRQTPATEWRGDARPAWAAPFRVETVAGNAADRRLFVELASRNTNVPADVDSFIAGGGDRPAVRLQLRPPTRDFDMDERSCRAVADQTYSEIERVCGQYAIDEISLFAAAPQALMMLLGQRFRGMRPVNFYEWTGDGYRLAIRVPGGAL